MNHAISRTIAPSSPHEPARDFVRAAFDGDFERADMLSRLDAHLGIHRDAAYAIFMQCAALEDLRPARAMLAHPSLAPRQGQRAMLHERHAIESCCKHDDARTLRALASLGLPVDAPMSLHGLYPLHYAARYDAPECVNALAGLGAPIDAADASGNSALHLAAMRLNLQAAAALLALGADPNFANLRKESPLHAAAEYGQLAIAKLLISHGANHSALDSVGRAPVEVAQAARFGHHADLARWLESFEASRSERQAILGATNPSNDASRRARPRV